MTAHTPPADGFGDYLATISDTDEDDFAERYRARCPLCGRPGDVCCCSLHDLEGITHDADARAAPIDAQRATDSDGDPAPAADGALADPLNDAIDRWREQHAPE